MIHITNDAISALDHIYRINLINSVSGYKSANLIGTASKDGVENVAVFSSVTHLGSNPPILGFIVRPTSIPRHTYKNIKDTEIYTINHIWEDHIQDAHHTSAKYPENISEFNMTALNAVYRDAFKAPFVKHAPVQMAMTFLEEVHIKTNNVVMVIGEIKDIYIKSNLLEPDGFVNLSAGKVATINGLDGYAVPNLKERLSYQRPK